MVWKYLDHGGETYKAYGLSGVFTYPAFQRQGYGRRIVEMGTAYIDAHDGDIGIFHCAPKLKEFYTRCGWTAMEQAVTWIGEKEVPVISDELMMIRFLNEKGRAGQQAFETQPLYFGDVTW